MNTIIDWLKGQRNGDKSPKKSRGISVNDIFHPTQEAVGDNFIGRQKLLNKIVLSLEIPGTPMFIYGPPGTGKSSIARRAAEITKRKYKRIFVDFNCDSKSLLEKLWIEVNGSAPEAKKESKKAKIGQMDSESAFQERLDSESVAKLLLKQDKIFR